MLNRIFLGLMLFPMAYLAASDANEAIMRSRVYCSAEQGIAFRYPYAWRAIDQYGGELLSKGMMVGTMGDKRVVVDSERKLSQPRLAQFSLLASEVAGKSLDQIGDAQAGEALTWQAFHYYGKDPGRPQGDIKWAPKGLEARQGVGKKCCVLAVKHGDRISGLVLLGGLDEADNKRVIASFEVLSGGPAKPSGKSSAHAMTWREKQWRDGNVISAEDKVMKGVALKPTLIPWSQAWEVETEHYHIMGNTSPARLVWQGHYFEALFRAYSKVYEPERMPPYKFEVHIFDSLDQFRTNAATFGFPMGLGMCGFFVPQLLSLWVYEDSIKFAGESSSVEHVSAHECSHQFLHVATNGNSKVPTWLNEGLAVYFESGIFRNGEFLLQPPVQRIELLKNQYQQNKDTLLPLGQYLDLHGHIDAPQYGEVYAMTHFWIFGQCNGPLCAHKKGCGLARFREYWQALKKGEDGNLSFERIFMADMIKAQGGRENAVREWTKALRKYVQGMRS